MVALIFCKGLTINDITLRSSRVLSDYAGDNHTAHLVSPSTALACVTNMSEKHKPTPLSAIQVKNQQKTIGTEDTLDSQLDEPIVDVCYNVRLAHCSVHTIHDNADRIEESITCLDNIKFQQHETETVCLCSKSTKVLT
jgi:hypothetical protein